jgi:hypothetical protein
MVTSHTIIGGGVGTGWAASYLWMKSSGYDELWKELEKYKAEIQETFDLAKEEE